ncbi:MAG: calcium/sodium antiporter [Balneolaceae bacterium]|nr:calcium/sodium antiporter [Balneolaceae bacterium]
MTVLLFIAGLAALIGGAELFLKGVDHFGVKWRISPLIMGLTVVAFATGAPELAISLQAAASGSADLVLGNIIGSNIANILLILGICALIKPLNITLRVVRIDVPIVIGASLLLYLLAYDGELTTLDGVWLMLGLIAYSLFTFIQIRKERGEEINKDLHEEVEKLASGWWFYLKNIGFLILGLAFIVKGSDWMVESAVEIATILGMSELVIGLTIVSIGTSLPEVATSVATIRKGNTDMAVANVLGSNLYNIFLTMGLTLIIAPNILTVSDAAIALDLPFMVAVSIACIPIFIAGLNLTLMDGIIFLFYYASYLTYLALDVLSSPLESIMENVMMWGILPATVVYMLIRIYIGRKDM